jgi:hypothetical protein
MNGKTVKQFSTLSTGFMQKTAIDVTGKQFAAGLYMLEATAGDKKQYFRLLKQ